MVLTRNKPQASDILTDSQVDLEDNNNAIDDSFGTDHYAASDLTADNGKHQILQMPSQGTNPTTHPSTTTDPKFYSYQDNATIGILQYMRGTSDKIQTPITCLQSGGAGITIPSPGTSSILDFNGVPYCMGEVMVVGISTGLFRGMGNGWFFWDGSSGRINAPTVSGTNLVNINLEFSGTTLRISNSTGSNLSNVSWTLRFNRIYTPT